MKRDVLDRLLLLAGSFVFVFAAIYHNWTACVILAGLWLFDIAWTLRDIKERQTKPPTFTVNVPQNTSADEILRAVRKVNRNRGGAA